MTREIVFTAPFDRMFRRLPARIRDSVYTKLELFQNDPAHPSLRVKRIQGSPHWEMSITMNYRITFDITEDAILLRKIGTHDILRTP